MVRSRLDIVAHLTKLFEVVEPAFRKAVIENTIKLADANLSRWLKRIEEGPIEQQGPMSLKGNHWTDYQYVAPAEKIKDDFESYYSLPEGTWKRQVAETLDRARYRPNAAKDRWPAFVLIRDNCGFVADHKAATRDANAFVDDAKRHFVTKQGQKITNAVGDREDLTFGEAKLELSHYGLILGYINVKGDNGDSFRLDMSIKWNTSVYGKPYLQYPAIFRSVKADGAPETKKWSEEWMAEHFGKKPLPPKPAPDPKRRPRRYIWGRRR